MVLDIIIIVGYIQNNICQGNDLNAEEVRQPHLFS